MNNIHEHGRGPGNPGMTSEALAEVARLKRSKKFAGLAKALLRVQTDKLWTEEGYTSFEEWGEKTVERKRSTLYLYLEIAEHLAELSEEQMNRLGVGKCKYLMYLAKHSGTIHPDWVQKAEKLDFPSFKRAVSASSAREASPRNSASDSSVTFAGWRTPQSTSRGWSTYSAW